MRKKPRKQTNFKDNLGKLLLDIGKLVFGGMFIGVNHASYHFNRVNRCSASRNSGLRLHVA